MYTIFLTEKDLIKKEHFPVIALINEASNANLLDFVNNINNRVGGSYDYSSYSFWDELDEYDKSNTPQFDGIWVGNDAGEEIIITLKELKQYLSILSSRLSSCNFSEIKELRLLIDSI